LTSSIIDTTTVLIKFSEKLVSLIIGKNWHIFAPDLDVNASDKEYLTKVSMKHVQWFGPYPEAFEFLASPEAIDGMVEVMNRMPRRDHTPFETLGEKSMRKGDKDFIMKMMKMDPNERPTAAQLLQDEWFEGV